MHRSNIYLSVTACLVFVLAAMFIHAAWAVRASQPVFARKVRLVRALELTDLSLFSEASYTRHPAMTDLSTPFQDSPMSLEHFPSGSLVRPPIY